MRDLDLRRVVRAERRRAGQRDHAVRREPICGHRRTSSSATARSTRATTSRRRTSRRPTTAATSSAARSAGRSRANRTFFFADYERHAAARRHHAGHQRADARRARRRFLAVAVRQAASIPSRGQPFPGGRIPPFFIRARSARRSPALYPLPNRSTPFANYVSSPTLRDDVDQFDARRRSRRLGGGSRLTGAVQLQRSAAARAVCRRRLLDDSRLRQRRRRGAARIWRSTLHAQPVVRARQRRAVRLQPRVASACSPRTRRSTNASVGLPALATNPRDAGLSLISIAGFSPLGHEYNNPQESTSDTFQLSDTRDLGARRAPAQVRRRVVRRPPVGVSRRAGARVPDLRRAGLHGQRAGRSAARTAGADRRRAARQPAEPPRAAAGACSRTTTGARRRR